MKNNTRSKSIITLTSLLLMAVFSACSAPASMDTVMDAPYAASEAADAEIAAEEAEYEMVKSGEMPATADRKIIGTANIDLVVEDSNAAVDDITALVQQTGGYVADSNFYHVEFGDGSTLQGSMTLRVPAGMLDQVMEQLGALAVTVSSQSLTRDDVTDQYTDLNARLRNLAATEEELLALLGEVRAKPEAKAEDILAVHRNVMEIRGEIEQVQGRMAMLDNLITLSTIHLSLRPDKSSLPIVEEGWRPGQTVEDALRSLIGSMQALGNAAIWLVLYALPIFLLLMLPVVIFVWLVIVVVKRVRKKHDA